MRDKRDVMRLHIKNGIRDLNGIRESYNTFASGGNIYDGPTEKTNQMQLSPLRPKPQVVDYSFDPKSYNLSSTNSSLKKKPNNNASKENPTKKTIDTNRDIGEEKEWLEN